MAQVFLLIGGNLGERVQNLSAAKEKIGAHVGEIEVLSQIYETEPWGFNDAQYFLNQLLIVHTELSAEALLDEIQKVELDLGRERKTEQMGSRTMDIDILFYDDLIIETNELTIPHPRLHLRQFALVPLNEIAQSMIHPQLGKSMEKLMLECEDKQEVNLLMN